MTDCLAALRAHADPDRAADMAAYHKIDRPYLGIANPVIAELAKTWRRNLNRQAQLAAARALWQSNIHEARIAAAKLLTLKRIDPDGDVWALIAGWVEDFDAWAIADHACEAGRLRLLADPARLDTVETWTQHPCLWVRRAALVMTLPWARMADPSEQEAAARERILGWAAGYADDPEWFIQKSVAWWLRELSTRDPARVTAFLAEHKAAMKPFAVREASRKLA